MLQDCEWKIRATERSCKARISAAETARNEALQDSERVAKEAQAQYEKVFRDEERPAQSKSIHSNLFVPFKNLGGTFENL